MDVLGDWLKIFQTHHKQLPKEFEYDHFFSGINILLEHDHHLILAKTLLLIYNNIEIFLGKARATLMRDILLKKHFWRLFLHWNVDIRDLYIQLVVYKVILPPPPNTTNHNNHNHSHPFSSLKLQMVRVEGQHQLLDEKVTSIKREMRLDR